LPYTLTKRVIEFRIQTLSDAVLSEKMLMPFSGCASSADEPLLEVRDLEVRFLASGSPDLPALSGINITIARGEIVGLMGESGAGKTTLALALLRLLQSPGSHESGYIRFDSLPILSMSEAELRYVRGARISIIYQDATILNPVIRVGDQLTEVLRAHRDWTTERCREESNQLLKEMGFEEVQQIYASYPHQLSGGQRQRIVVALALVCRPALVIADEPTASLDPDTALSIVERFKILNRSFNTSFLIISHDVALLSRLTDRIMVMYAGRIVEQGPTGSIVREPLHPYTRALMNCALPERRVDDSESKRPLLSTIAGIPSGAHGNVLRCGFESRCPDRLQVCGTTVPKEILADNGHRLSCFKIGNQ
jgi:peptide/nickel transport system ATP-binding protein